MSVVRQRAWQPFWRLFVPIAAICIASSSPSVRAADRSPLPDTIDRIRQGIVAVGTSEPTRNPPFQFRGTGFAVGDGTLIVTNNHVLPDDVDDKRLEVVSIAVPLASGDALVHAATVVVRDPQHDVALLRVSAASFKPLTPLVIGDSSKVREGELLAFTGFPIGNVIGLFPTTHRALVSAITPAVLVQPNAKTLNPAMVNRLRADRFSIFQLDGTAYPGNSGSPLYDIETGEVVAIVNSTLVKQGKEAALSQPSGISYAVPALFVTRLLERAESPRP